MKSRVNNTAAILVSLLLPCTAIMAANLEPVVLKTTGKVTVTTPAGETKPAVVKQPVAVGSTVSTGRGDRAVIALAPKAAIAPGPKTDLKLIKSSVTGSGTHVESELVQGTVSCALNPGAKGKQKYVLLMGEGDSAEAVGTTWKAVKEQGKKELTVTTGTVQWNSGPSGEEIKVPAGSILIATYDIKTGQPNLESLIVINLIKGTVAEYPVAGGAPTIRDATTTEMAMARDKFAEAVEANAEFLTPEELAELKDLLAQINTKLSELGLALVTLTPATTGIFTGRSGSSNNPADTVSGTSPR